MKRRTHQIQISLRIQKPNNVVLTREFFNSVLHYRAATGKDVPGVKVAGIVWTVNQREHHYEETADITDALNKVFAMGLKIRVQALG